MSVTNAHGCIQWQLKSLAVSWQALRFAKNRVAIPKSAKTRRISMAKNAGTTFNAGKGKLSSFLASVCAVMSFFLMFLGESLQFPTLHVLQQLLTLV